MTGKAADLKTYLTMLLDNDIQTVENTLKFSDQELEQYKDLLKQCKEVNGSKASTAEKGKVLENLVLFVIEKSVVFEVYKNVKTSSNEIDLLVRLNRRGQILIHDGFLSFEKTFLCECKNYNKKIDVTWLGKFYSLLHVTQNNLGILFSYHGLTGRGWSHASGLTKKLFLLNKQNTQLIDFNIRDFELLAQGHSFIEIIKDKIFALQLDVSLDHIITPHPNEEQFMHQNTK